MKVLVCGGRGYGKAPHLWETLDQYPIHHIVAGDATGADRLAARYAESRGIPWTVYPALWQSLGRAAGPTRNRKMLNREQPDLVIAFPGGPGTAHMVRIAQEGGYRVVRG